MKKLLTILTLSSFSVIGYSQYNWDFGIQGGASNYLGEMGGKSETRKDFVVDLKFKKTQFTTGAFVRYKFTSLVSAQLAFNWVRICGADNASTNPARVGRNLSFQSDIKELALTAQIFFYEMPDLGHTYRYRNDFKMYAFAGIAAYHNEPKTYYNGTWEKLRPLKTEGKSYSAFGASVPLGLGFLFTINKKHRIGWEFNWRTTFSDYLDDVSKNYVDRTDTEGSDLAWALSNRHDELIGNSQESVKPIEDNNYRPHTENGKVIYPKRGDPTHNDTYITTSVYYSYVMRGKSNLYKSKYGSIFRKSKSKKRKIRAKF